MADIGGSRARVLPGGPAPDEIPAIARCPVCGWRYRIHVQNNRQWLGMIARDADGAYRITCDRHGLEGLRQRRRKSDRRGR